MSSVKFVITLVSETLGHIDSLVSKSVFPSRSRAIQLAVSEKLARMKGSRLAAECAKLDPEFEKALAEEGLGKELEHSHRCRIDQPTPTRRLSAHA